MLLSMLIEVMFPSTIQTNRFAEKLSAHGLTLRRAKLQTLQINVGRKCNQTCRHCHVDAAPWRTEMMPEPVARRVGDWIRDHRPPVVDITGGAPELSEHFRYFVETARECGCHIIDRNNLTIIETPAYGWLPEYLAAHEVEIVASLPCYIEENVNAQRGDGVFEKSIRALKKLNAVGYGTRLPLNLVYNPLGPKLPPTQTELEADYKRELKQRYGVEFTGLFTITNQPIARFAEDLRTQGKWDEYLELLANSFNPATVESLMCRSTLSVGWMGEIYDCDFNQMLKMQVRNGKPLYLWDVTPDYLKGWAIQTGVHCLACTAGCGSSCVGALENFDRQTRIPAAASASVESPLNE
jgi:radical SAM/Cys-rich protein